MPLSSLEHANHQINDTRRRIENLRAELALEPLNGTTALRTRVLQQMELSLASLERNRDALLSRSDAGGLDPQRG